jgi:hypothetical protein
MSSALTNDPATIGQPQLVAATADSTAALSAPTTETQMGMYKMADEPAAKVKGIVEGTHEDEKDMCGKMKAALSEHFPEHFSPGAEAKMTEDMGKDKPAVLAADEEEKKEMKALRADLLRLTGKSDRVEAVAVLTAMKHASEEVAALTAAAAKQTGAAFQSIVDKARADKKLTPADCDGKTEAGKYIAGLRDRGDEGIKALSAYVSALKPRVVTMDTSVKERETDRLDPKGEEVVTLNATEIETCRKNGIKQEDMLRVKKERVAELKANGVTPRN